MIGGKSKMMNEKYIQTLCAMRRKNYIWKIKGK